MQQAQTIPHDALVVGVDVGGTKIAAGVVDTQGNVHGRIKITTDTSTPERTLSSIAQGVRSAVQATGVTMEQVHAVGLGIPGMVDPAQGICQISVNLGWQNVEVRSWLERELQLPCAIENDVSAAALGESIYGVSKGLDNMVYLSLGTGIATRAIINGKLYRGAHGMAGEIGHASFNPTGPLCRCGGRGCLEALAAGPALALRAQDELRSGKSSLLRDLIGKQPLENLRSEDVFEAARKGDALATKILREAGQYLAYGIYLLSMSLDPQIVIIGGGLAVEGSPLIEAIHEGVTRWLENSPIFREMSGLNLLRLSSLQHDAGITGAAALITSAH
ncbi:ROK family protein [Ktedonospora formicarum]|uniref:Glucokinase n=1 Tax=Ktedonospora formicarum TaxID=2778364 RepID=A0A8J3HYF0_9CHLR|nr:ROK family protein [Ktedonospora formicarum]GHO43298.1 glucokinase [Ktedonospora formicarum]